MGRARTATGAFLSIVLATLASAASAAGQTRDERIAFESGRDGNTEIYVMNGDGSLPTRLTFEPALDGLPSMPAVGDKVAFASLRHGNSELYVMDASGGNTKRLTFHPAIDTFETFSPDGTKIAWATNRHAPAGDGDVRWSEIYVMNADGSGQRRLTANAVFDGFPSWTPDSKKILFTSTRDGAEAEIYSMNSDGSAQTRLTNSPLDEVLPWMSPDGRRIAFHSDSDGDVELYTVNADGSGQRQLTNDTAVPLPPPLPAIAPDDLFPSWSRDSRRLVFWTTRDGNWEIYSMNAADGSDARNLSRHTSYDLNPSVAAAPAGGPRLSGNARARPRGISLRGSARCRRITPRRLRCVLRLRGRVVLPATTRAGCRGGRVAIRVRRGRRTVVRSRPRTSARCGFRLKKRFRMSARRVRRLTVRSRFSGNGFVAPKTGRRKRIKVRVR